MPTSKIDGEKKDQSGEKKKIECDIGDPRKLRKRGQQSMEDTLKQATLMTRALLKDRSNKNLEMQLKRLLGSMNYGLQAAMMKEVADPWKKAYLLSAIARKNYLEYSLVPPSKQKECFNDVLSTIMMACESCSPQSPKGGHPNHEATCLEMASKLLIGADRVKEAIPLSRKMSKHKVFARDKQGVVLKYHMAVIQLYVLHKPGDRVEPGYLNSGSTTYKKFGKKEGDLLREHMQLFLQIDDLKGADLDPTAPFDDWPKEMAHKKNRRAAVLGLYLYHFLSEGRAIKDQKESISLAFPIFDRLAATGLYRDLCELCIPLASTILRVVKGNSEKVRRQLLVMEKELGSLQVEGLIGKAAAMLERKPDTSTDKKCEKVSE